VIRVDTDLVTIPVSARDRKGRFIYDLRREEFSIYENGVRQELAFFEPVETPVTVILMLATNTSTWRKHEKIKEAAIDFTNLLRLEDRLMVVSYASGVTVEAEATNDRTALQQAIRKIGKGSRPYLYNAIDWVIKGPLKKIRGRKAVVLFTDGTSCVKGATYKSTLHAAEEVDGPIYPVQFDTYDDLALMSGGTSTSTLRNVLLNLPFIAAKGIAIPPSADEGYQTAGKYLLELAEKSGGRLYKANEDAGSLQSELRQIIEELSHQYRIGYYPKVRAPKRERRQLSVRLSRANLAVHARDSYIFEP
jgi:VWFA-related protein